MDTPLPFGAHTPQRYTLVLKADMRSIFALHPQLVPADNVISGFYLVYNSLYIDVV